MKLGKKNTIKRHGHEIRKKNSIKRQGHEVGNFTIFGNNGKVGPTAKKKTKNTMKGQGWTQPEKVYKMNNFFCTMKGQGWTPPKSFIELPYFGGAP